MATPEQILREIQNLRAEVSNAIVSAKLSPQQITIVNGLSDISKSLGTIKAGEFLALSTGIHPEDADANGTFISALGKTFGGVTYHVGGVNLGVIQWGANSSDGKFMAHFGEIGGWTLSATSLIAGTGANTVGLDSGGTNPAIYAGSATPASAPFRVTKAGVLTATGATISGSITSTSGTIGGWTLGATSLTAGTGANTVGLDSGGTNPALYAGSATPASAPFRVTKDGALVATNATLTGSLSAAAGVVRINSSGFLITEDTGDLEFGAHGMNFVDGSDNETGQIGVGNSVLVIKKISGAGTDYEGKIYIYVKTPDTGTTRVGMWLESNGIKYDYATDTNINDPVMKLFGGAYHFCGAANPYIRLMEGASNEYSYVELTDVNAGTATLNKIAASGDAVLGLNAVPYTGTDGSYIRMFYGTTTSGARELRIYKGDGSTDQTFKVDAATGAITLCGGITSTGFWNIPSSGELTISAGGTITVTGSYHTVDTYGDAATDDLVTINGGSVGDILILSSASSARDTTVKDGTDIELAGDFTFTSVQDTLTLRKRLSAVWTEISRSDNA